MSDPATIYEEWFAPDLFALLGRLVSNQIEVTPSARVLDLACGSGIVARTVAPRVGTTGRVVELDANPAMQSIAQDERAALIDAVRDDLAAPVREATIGDFLRFPMRAILAKGTLS